MEKVFNHTAHKALWNWLSKNPDKEKIEWPGWEWNGGKYDDSIRNGCFACMYTFNPYEGNINCHKCPVIWPDNIRCNYCNEEGYVGLYIKYMEENLDFPRRSELAAQIRDLPVREGVKCI